MRLRPWLWVAMAFVPIAIAATAFSAMPSLKVGATPYLIVSADEAEQVLGPEAGRAFAENVKASRAEMNQKGAIEVDARNLLRGEAVSNHLITIDQANANATFVLREPGWLPQGTQLLGVLPGGPTAKGPWRSLRLYFKSPNGEFWIEQGDVSNGTVVYAREFVTERVGKHQAAYHASKVKQDSSVWHRFVWTDGTVAFNIMGNLPLGQLKRIAESL